MRNRNLWVLAAVVVAIAVVAVIGIWMPQELRSADPASTLMPDPTVESTVTPTEEAAPATANAYLLVTVGGTLYEPIAIYEDSKYTIRQEDGKENVIHVTPDSVCMESSTCENQDCVLQGTVTLENMDERVLANMIICLPNEITLELYTPQGLAEVLTQIENAN